MRIEHIRIGSRQEVQMVLREMVSGRLKWVPVIGGLGMAVGAAVPCPVALMLLASLRVLVANQIEHYLLMPSVWLVLTLIPDEAWLRLSFAILLLAWTIVVVVAGIVNFRVLFCNRILESVNRNEKDATLAPLVIWGPHRHSSVFR